MTMRKAPVKRMPAIGLPDLLCQWIVSVAQLLKGLVFLYHVQC
jgi:hypothetical protein